MKNEHFLIKSLEKKEKEKVKKYLNCFSDNKREDKKSLRLFKQLDKAETYISPSAVVRKIYKEEGADAFEKLLQRLTAKIFEGAMICLPQNNTGRPDERILMLLKARQLLNQFNYFYETKGALDVLPRLLDKIISLCKKYELYSTLVEALRWKKRCYAATQGEKQWSIVQKEISFYKQCLDAVETAHDYLNRLQFMGEDKGQKNSTEILTLLATAIPELKTKQAQTDSALAGYFIYYLRYEREIILNNYQAARSIILDLLSYIKKHKCLNSAQRAGIAFNYLEVCEMKMGRFDEALDHARNAFNYIPKDSFNHIIATEWEFYALFFSKRFIEAIACAEKITSPSVRKETGEFRFNKFMFLLANALFKTGRHKRAEDILSQKFELKNDKEGWEFNWRVLQIMIYIELEKQDKASEQIKALYMFMYDNKTNHYFSPRQKMIASLLSLAEKQGFDYSLIHKKAYSLLSNLENGDKDYGWQILSSELIPVHVWAKEKMEKRVKVLVR
ncbi:MAG TPA: hypothetical protein VJ111_08920 [Chitinophagaceae bacterium]|nr:hypothetical protein [Chitinophagaceae bacterium]